MGKNWVDFCAVEHTEPWANVALFVFFQETEAGCGSTLASSFLLSSTEHPEEQPQLNWTSAFGHWQQHVIFVTWTIPSHLPLLVAG